MNNSINYIISNFLGTRRFCPSLNKDPLFYIKKQCDFFKNNTIPNVEMVSFVLSKCDIENRDQLFIDFINTIKLPVKHELIVRENRGFSYGAWQEVVMKNINYDFHFLIEDDYLPICNNFIDYFKTQLDEETIFICQVYICEHCSMSNGFLNSKIIRKEINNINPKMPLNAVVDNECNYVTGINNQILFLKNFTDLNYKIKDLTKKCSIPFSDHLGNIIQRGNYEKETIITSIAK